MSWYTAWFCWADRPRNGKRKVKSVSRILNEKGKLHSEVYQLIFSKSSSNKDGVFNVE